MDDKSKEPLPFLPPPPPQPDFNAFPSEPEATVPLPPVPLNRSVSLPDFSIASPSPEANKWEERIKELEKKNHLNDDSKKNMGEQIKELEKKLDEEKQHSLMLSVRAEEEKKAAAEVESSLHSLQDRMRQEKRQQELEENKRKAEEKVSQLERRLNEEREAWVETLKNQLALKDLQEHTLEQKWEEQRKQWEENYIREKKNWQKLLQGKEEEIASLNSQKQLAEEKIRGEAERKISDLSATIKHLESKLESTEKKYSAEKDNWLKRLNVQEEENMAIKVQLSLSQVQLNDAIKRLEGEKNALEDNYQQKLLTESKQGEERNVLAEEKIKKLKQYIQQSEKLRQEQEREKVLWLGRIREYEEKIKDWETLSKVNETEFDQETEQLRLAYEQRSFEKERELINLKEELENKLLEQQSKAEEQIKELLKVQQLTQENWQQKLAEREEKIKKLEQHIQQLEKLKQDQERERLLWMGRLRQYEEKIKDWETLNKINEIKFEQETEQLKTVSEQKITEKERETINLRKELENKENQIQELLKVNRLAQENWQQKLDEREEKINLLTSQLAQIGERIRLSEETWNNEKRELTQALQQLNEEKTGEQQNFLDLNRKIENMEKQDVATKGLLTEREKEIIRLEYLVRELEQKKTELLTEKEKITEHWENKVSLLQKELEKALEEIKIKGQEKESEISGLALWTEEELKQLADKLEQEKKKWLGIIDAHQQAAREERNKSEQLEVVLNEIEGKLEGLETEKRQREEMLEDEKHKYLTEKELDDQEYKNLLKEKETLSEKNEKELQLIQELETKVKTYNQENEQIRQQLQQKETEKDLISQELNEIKQKQLDEKVEWQQVLEELRGEKRELGQKVFQIQNQLQLEREQKNSNVQILQENMEAHLEQLKSQHRQEQKYWEDNLNSQEEEIKLLRNSLKEKESLGENRLNEREKIWQEQKHLWDQQLQMREKEWREEKRSWENRLAEKEEKLISLHNQFSQKETEILAKEIEKQTRILEENKSEESLVYKQIAAQLQNLQNKIISRNEPATGIISRLWRCLNRTVIIIRWPGWRR